MDDRTGPGQVLYRSLDGLTYHLPGPDPWYCNVPGVHDLDLMNLRRLCIATLRKVEDELAERGLLDRLTPRSER